MNIKLPVAGYSKNNSLIASDFPPHFNNTLIKGNMK